MIVQPENRGTAAGILLPSLTVLLDRDPVARFLVLPSDHYVADERKLRRALLEGSRAAATSADRVLLLGMTPSGFDPEYGWMLPNPGDVREPRAVSRFVEKPDRETAEELTRGGALLNAFMLFAHASALLRLYQKTRPRMLSMMRRCLRGGAGLERLELLYRAIPRADFSRDVLEPSPGCLSMVAVPDCGWSDLGTPARVQLFLSQREAGEATPVQWMSFPARRPRWRMSGPVRKRIMASSSRGGWSPAEEWLSLERLAQIELTSEDPAHPVENALRPAATRVGSPRSPGSRSFGSCSMSPSGCGASG